MVVRVSLGDAPVQLRAAAVGLRALETKARRIVYRLQREEMGPVWTKTLSEHMTLRPQQMMLKGARVKAGNPPTFLAANSRRQWSTKGKGGGLIPVLHWAGYDFGAADKAATYQLRTKSGATFTVTRHVTAGHPPRSPGRILVPTIATIAPRVAALFVQTYIRAVFEALDGQTS